MSILPEYQRQVLLKVLQLGWNVLLNPLAGLPLRSIEGIYSKQHPGLQPDYVSPLGWVMTMFVVLRLIRLLGRLRSDQES